MEKSSPVLSSSSAVEVSFIHSSTLPSVETCGRLPSMSTLSAHVALVIILRVMLRLPAQRTRIKGSNDLAPVLIDTYRS